MGASALATLTAMASACTSEFEGCEASRTCPSPSGAGGQVSESGAGGRDRATGDAGTDTDIQTDAGNGGRTSPASGGGGDEHGVAGVPIGGAAGDTQSPEQGGGGGSTGTHAQGGDAGVVEAGTGGAAGEPANGGEGGGNSCADGECEPCETGCVVFRANFSASQEVAAFILPIVPAVPFTMEDEITFRIYGAAGSNVVVSYGLEFSNGDRIYFPLDLPHEGWIVNSFPWLAQYGAVEISALRIDLIAEDADSWGGTTEVLVDSIVSSAGSLGPFEFQTGSSPFDIDLAETDDVDAEVSWRGP